MKFKTTTCMVAAVLAVMPISSASAHDHWRHEGPVIGLLALGAAAVVGAAAIVTAPINALANAAAPLPYYAPPQNYYAQPVYARPVYYAPPQAYYAQQPVYYAAPQGYYYGR